MERSSKISAAGISVNICQPIEGNILTNHPYALKAILNCLDNFELLKCKRVCSFWREIADEIMSKRIIIITRNIPYKMTRKAVAEPELVLCLDFQQHQRVQFLVEFDLENINYKFKVSKKAKVKIGEPPPKNCEIKTQIAIFPSLPGIKVERFLFYSEYTRLRYEERMAYLTELINVPKKELKFILWFTDGIAYNYKYAFPDFGVPALILINSISVVKLDRSRCCAITFSGERVNVVSLKIIDELPYNRIKSKFVNEIQKLKDYKIEPFKCLALLFSTWECPRRIQNYILLLLKKTYPNLPVLLFSDMILYDLQMYEEKCEEYQITRKLLLDVVVIRIVIILLN